MVRNTDFFIQFKEIKNRILIKLVFDSKGEKSDFIEKILENIEIVEYLKFDSMGKFEEITTKENVKIFRILLNLIQLISRANLQSHEILSTQDKLKIETIFENSK